MIRGRFGRRTRLVAADQGFSAGAGTDAGAGASAGVAADASAGPNAPFSTAPAFSAAPPTTQGSETYPARPNGQTAQSAPSALSRLGSPLSFWRRTPLRARLALAATVAVAAGIGGGVGFAYVAVRHSLTQQVDSGLQRQGAKVQDLLLTHHLPRYDETRSQQFGDTLTNSQFIDSTGTPLQPKLLPATLRTPYSVVVLAPASTRVIPISSADAQVAAGSMNSYMHSGEMNGQHVRILTLSIGQKDRALQIDAPLTAMDQQLSTLGWELFGAGAAGIVLAAGLGWLVTRTALRPVAELTSTAERIAATHDLAHRIPIDGAPGEPRDELGRLAATFNTMLDAVQEATDRQRQLVADASHELRTPLTSLRTNVEVLAHAQRLEPEDRQALVSGIMSGLDDMTMLVSDTVELARGEEQAALFEELRFDLLVRRCVDRAAMHWPKAVFKEDLEDCLVVGVTDRLAKAVRNLLDNAAKFSPDGGLVEVRTAPGADGTVTLTVRDHGPGIPEADLPHVFDRFYRAASARDLPGSGLGLAIVAQVAVGHGGGVTVAGAQGGGAEFRLTLPVSRG